MPFCARNTYRAIADPSFKRSSIPWFYMETHLHNTFTCPSTDPYDQRRKYKGFIPCVFETGAIQL